jgi:hypothetical protein
VTGFLGVVVGVVEDEPFGFLSFDKGCLTTLVLDEEDNLSILLPLLPVPFVFVAGIGLAVLFTVANSSAFLV